MNFPRLSSTSVRASIIDTFKGLNQNIQVAGGEFSEMKNVSCRFYPAIATRKPRGARGTQITKPHGMLWKNGLFYVDGTSCYYKGTLVSGLSVADTDKQLVGMGAYICIFPDKKVFNTSNNEVTSMVATYTQSGNITFAPLSSGSTFTKITASGIGNVFNKLDGVKISGATGSEYDFNGTHIIQDKGTDYIVVIGQITNTYTQASGLSFSREVPDMDYVCELDNRLWGCSSANHEIYASKLGDPLNWNCFEGVSTDSYAVTVGSDGDFTGCIAHLGYAIFFKENTIHMMYGNKPANFALNTKTLPGVRTGCSKSLCIVNETLYFVGRNGIYAFDGSVPQKISEGIDKEVTVGVASQQDARYYLSCKLGGVDTMLVFSPSHNVWDVEDDTVFEFATYGEGVLNFIDQENYITTITGSRDEVIKWVLESGDIVESSLDEKYISKIKLNLMLDIGSEVSVMLKFDDDPMWHKKGLISSTANKTVTIPIIPQRCNKFRYRLEGKGQFKLLGLAYDVEGGSEINGSISVGYRR